MTESDFFKWMNMSNNEGAKHRRLVGIEKNPKYSAADNWHDEYILLFDDGPQSASDDPWPR